MVMFVIGSINIIVDGVIRVAAGSTNTVTMAAKMWLSWTILVWMSVVETISRIEGI